MKRNFQIFFYHEVSLDFNINTFFCKKYLVHVVCQGTGKIFSLYINRIFSIYVSITEAPGISFVVPMTSLYRGALNQGFTLMNIRKRRVNKNDEFISALHNFL